MVSVVDKVCLVEEGAGNALHTRDASFLILGAVVASREYWTLAPNVGASQLWG